MKVYIFFLLFIGCDFIENKPDQVLARLGDEFYYKSDLIEIFPTGLSEEDSVIFVKRKKKLDYGQLNLVRNCLIFVESNFIEAFSLLDSKLNCIVECDNPRLEYAKFLNKYVNEPDESLVNFNDYDKAIISNKEYKEEELANLLSQFLINSWSFSKLATFSRNEKSFEMTHIYGYNLMS